MANIFETAAMRRALDHAVRGPVSGPNPRIGGVILGTSGAIVGDGVPPRVRTPHTEVDPPAATERADLGIDAIGRAARLVTTDVRRVDDDVLIVARSGAEPESVRE